MLYNKAMTPDYDSGVIFCCVSILLQQASIVIVLISYLYLNIKQEITKSVVPNLSRLEVRVVAVVSQTVSDISGQGGSESDFVTLTVRDHPSVSEPKALDVLLPEIANLKDAGNIVILEVKNNGDTKQIVMTLTEFRKVVPDEVVVKARGTRGRRPGWSPSGK